MSVRHALASDEIRKLFLDPSRSSIPIFFWPPRPLCRSLSAAISLDFESQLSASSKTRYNHPTLGDVWRIYYVPIEITLFLLDRRTLLPYIATINFRPATVQLAKSAAAGEFMGEAICPMTLR